MTTKSFRGLLVATAAVMMLGTTGAYAAGPSLSAKAGKPLIAAQKAANAKDWAAATASLNEAKALSGLTPYDQYKLAQMELFVDVNTQNLEGAAVAAVAMVESPAQPEEDKAGNLKTALIVTLNAKQYPKAITYAKALEATNPTDQMTLTTIGQAYYFGADYAGAAAFAQKRIDAAIAAGQRPARDELEILMNSQVALKDEAGAEKTLESLVSNYNDPKDWTQMILISYGTKGIRDVDVVWLGRLQFISGATVAPADASMIGNTASRLTFYGDAEASQKLGGTGAPDSPTKAANDKKTIPAQIAAGAKANGTYNAKLAEALYSYGMFTEAEAAARLAIQKGDANDKSEPAMVLAQSLIAQNKYDEAITTLGQVTGGGPATPRIVRLWTIYATNKKTPPAPAGTPAPAPATAAK